MNADGAKYWAFISYSHRDAQVAKALQRALETYRLPKRLAGTQTAAGIVPAYLKPVFRDRDEMQAGADLKTTVREALTESRYLIVVCSPDAANSPWVNQEVIEFKKLHGEKPVLALIAGGEPFATCTPGRETEECFPRALRFALTPEGKPEGAPLEPIAADLRPQGDGKRLAILKLIAGMVGVGVDELVRRDAQRRARRLAYVASGAIAGMAVMAVLTVMAIQSSNEAQSQRAQAEELIEFMLGDLRKKLDPVGRLDVLDTIGEKAVSYYEKQDADRLDVNSLARRSRAMHYFGEIREQRGKLDEALAAFTRAADTTAKLLERQPNDGQRIFDHAQSVYWVGYVARRRGQMQAAEDAFRKYSELTHQLVQIEPNNVDWKLEYAAARQNLGVVELESLRLKEALESFAIAKSVESQLIPVKPEAALDLADAQGWIAKTLEASGDYGKAIVAQQERITVLNSMTASNSDRRIRQQISDARYQIGRLEFDLGNIGAAEMAAVDATRQAHDLVSADPANMFWLSALCFHETSLAEIQYALGKRELARIGLDGAMSRMAGLISTDKTKLIWQVTLLGRALALKAGIALDENHAPPVIDLQRYLTQAKGFHTEGKRLTADQITTVAAVDLALGDALQRLGKYDVATESWRASVEQLQQISQPEDFRVLTLLARAQLRLGNFEAANLLAAQVQASNYRHPAYAALVTELTHAAGRGQSISQSGRN